MLIAHPKTALIYVTNQCNLSCRHCAVSSGKKVISNDQISSSKKLIRIINKCKEIGITYISLTGGEPLIRKDIIEILGAVKNEADVRIAVNTNLTFLPESFNRLITDELVYEFCISMDGVQASTHDAIRGDGSFNKTLHNLETVLNLREQFDSELKISFTVVPTQLNYKEIEDIISFAQNMRIDEIQFEHLIPDGSAADNIEQLSLRGRELLVTYEKIMKAILDNNLPVIKSNMITNAFIRYYNWKNGSSIPYRYFSCTSPHQYIYISYDGTVVPCAAYTEQTGRQGLTKEETKELNILSNEFSDIIRCRPFQDFLEKKTDSSVQSKLKPCNVCKFHGKYCTPCISNLIRGGNSIFDLCYEALDAVPSSIT